LGIFDEKVADVKGNAYKASPHFNEAEWAILDLTIQTRDDTNRVSDEL